MRDALSRIVRQKRRIVMSIYGKSTRLTAVFLAAGFMIAGLLLGIGWVQASDTAAPAQTTAAAGTAFTYQGRLLYNGTAINGSCDLTFRLYDAASSGTQIGGSQTIHGVVVDDGFFYADLDFGSGAFTGDARFLQITIDSCPNGASNATLDPLIELKPVPYAMYADSAQSLSISNTPALRLQATTSTPNIIGGHSSNSVNTSEAGATIGGGGSNGFSNIITGSFGTIGGGLDNSAGYAAVVGGGDHNAARGSWSAISGGGENTTVSQYAAIGGGSNNAVSGDSATIGGGYLNLASGEMSTIGGGRNNTANDAIATIGGGFQNTSSGHSATIGGGQNNTAEGDTSTIGGGYLNTASNNAATISGGQNNEASGDYATIPGGTGAKASLHGQMAYAGGHFDFAGDAQTSLYVMRRTSTVSGTWQTLYLDGVDKPLTLAPGHTLAFDILIAGRSSGGTSAGFYCWGVIDNDAGTTIMISSNCFPLGQDDPVLDIQIISDDNLDALLVLVEGNDEEIRWTASVRTVEVGW
jgi:hypothetical protein